MYAASILHLVSTYFHMQNNFCILYQSFFSQFQSTFKLLDSFRSTYADYIFNVAELKFIIECIRDPLP